MNEFIAWPKTPRLFRDMVITEKLDGTNSAIVFNEDGEIFVQSRNREITPDNDNYGFAGWAYKYREGLFETLGKGRHYGEFWGKGIQRHYGQVSKRFSLFNQRKHADLFAVIGDVVVDSTKVLYRGEFSTVQAQLVLKTLGNIGSMHAPGFMNPEGIVVFHEQAGQVFKLTFEGDKGKWELGAGSPADLQGMLEAEGVAA